MSRILMISGDTLLAQGKQGAFYNTLKEFHKYWDRVDIIIPKTEQKINNLFGNVFIHSSPYSKLRHPWFITRKGKELYDKYKFDKVVVHEFPPFYNGIGARWLWNKIKVPYLLEIHHIPGHPKAANLKERVYKNLFRFFIKSDSSKAKAVRVVNQKQVPEFLIKSGVPKDKIKYIPSAYIDLDVFKKIDVEKKYDLVFAARLEKNKGIHNLIEAIKIVSKKRDNISLLILGGGSIKNKLVDYVLKNNLEKNVHFSGWLDTANDVARAYNSARIFINPSFNEGGPRVALEAMACGLPVITTRVGLMIDLIIDGENGLFMDWNPSDMSDKISRLLNRTDLQNSFSVKSTRIALQFDKKSELANYATKVQQLLR